MGWLSSIWAGITKIAGAVSTVFSYLRDEELRESGRNEANLQNMIQANTRREEADEIESDPVPTDPSDLLDGL